MQSGRLNILPMHESSEECIRWELLFNQIVHLRVQFAVSHEAIAKELG